VEYAPMLCEKSDKVPTGDLWALEPKLDGWRGIIGRHLTGVSLYGGRNGSNYTGTLPYIEAEVCNFFPPDTWLDGELIAADGWGNVQSVMRSSGAHFPTDRSPGLRFVIFDMLRCNGQEIVGWTYEQRRELLEVAQLDQSEFLRRSFVLEATEQNHLTILELGGEGTVAKRKNSTYLPGRRSRNWIKVKPPAHDTVDCTIVAFKPGEPGSEFAGMVGAIEFELPNGKRSRCSGFDMKLRRELTANGDRYIGMIVEVAHWGETAEGKLRHPQFRRLRTDR